MKRRFFAVILSFALLLGVFPVTAAAASGLPDLTDKSIYYTSDYRSGDCILSSAKSMLRRAAIARKSAKWNTITNTSLRSSATVYGRLFKNTFTYTNNGITYKIVNQELKGNTSQKMKDISALLANHPEGIVIWGSNAARTGPHGVLIVSRKNNVLYAVDSTHNNNSNVGIEPWGKTTMKPISYCSDVWYIASVNGVASTTAAKGKSTLCATGIDKPESIKQGHGFGVTGSVQSNYKITNVTISIIDSKGKAAISRSAKPNSCIYELSKLDSAVRFGTLSPGRYTYRIQATDAKKGSAVLHENAFTVTKSSRIMNVIEKITNADSTLTGKNISQPDTLSQGKGFPVRGYIYSNKKIKYVEIDVINSAGKTVIKASAKPNSIYYNLSNLDSKVRFGTLAAGSYRYVVAATDTSETRTLADKSFTVSSSAASSSTSSSINISSVRAPSALKKGKAFTIKGKVKSSQKLTGVKVEVLTEDGTSVLAASAKPGKKSYSILNLDAKVKFGLLARGTYTYRVLACNGGSWQTVFSQSFTVQ